MKLSNHLMQERAGRYAFIATTVGIGQVVHKYHRLHNGDNRPIVVNITSTGVVMVEGEDGSIVTLYLASITEIAGYFNNRQVPCVLEARVKTNMKRGYIQLQNNFD